MSKYDLTDGFYCIFLAQDDTLKLVIMMPCYDRETQLAAMPLLLMMGWTKLPPMFSTTSETATDLANVQLTCHHNQLPCHHLENLASTHDNWDPPSVMLKADTTMLAAPGNTPSVTLAADTTMLTADIDPSLMPTYMQPCKPEPELRLPLLLHEGPVAHVDIYMDDFISLAQGSQELCQDTRRCIMHAINQVFAQPNERTLNRKEAVLEKKMNKGDGSWNQQKEILGWILDTHKGTMELTDHKKEQVTKIFGELRGMKCISIKK